MFLFQIDEQVARIMTDEQLGTHITLQGDLLALRNFLKPAVEDKTKVKKQSLLGKLKERLQKNEETKENENQSSKKQKKKCIKNRLLDRDWMDALS